MTEKKSFRIAKRLLRGVLIAIAVFFLCCNVYVLVARHVFKNDMPTLFGIGAAMVVSPSMEPDISVGDVVVFGRSKAYAVGNVITYYEPLSDIYITHAIIREENGAFVTQGVNNDTPDPNPVSPEQILGKVIFTVRGVGGAMEFLQSPLGMLILFAALGLLIFLPELTEYVRGAAQRKRAGGTEPPEAESSQQSEEDEKK